LVAVVALFAPTLRAADDDPGARASRVERWLRAASQHVPGADDAWTREISDWSLGELSAFRVDVRVLLSLIRDPRLSVFETKATEALECLPCIAPGADAPQASQLQRPQRIRYTDWQLHRLKVLACAAAGLLADPECVKLHGSTEIDGELLRLADLAAAAKRRGDDNYVHGRGALLEADVAMSNAPSVRHMDLSGADAQASFKIRVVDGRQTDIGLGEIHWDIGRVLLDGTRPPAGAMVNRWYLATAAWMQRDSRYQASHLARARALFPNDAALLFLSGSLAEAYAAPSMQSLLRSAVVPTGFVLEVRAERAELADAETWFRRATKADPGFIEARVRLGHVLLARGKPQEAAAELRTAIVQDGEAVVQYFDGLLLGAAEEVLGRFTSAREAYARAAAIFPRAQSPRLALSALATRMGDRKEALAAIAPLFELPAAAAGRDDPWWDYFVSAGRRADALLAEMRRPFIETTP
jgi:tetratricopeptide (TPR) repeat protein